MVSIRGDRYGNYVYQRSTSRSELMSDLRAVDLGLSSDFSKLASNEPLNLSGKVIVVHGVQGYLDLPTTVGSAWGSQIIDLYLLHVEKFFE